MFGHLGDVTFQVNDVRLDPAVQLVHRGGQSVIESLCTDGQQRYRAGRARARAVGRQSYLRSLRLFAADVSQTLDLGLQLLRLPGDLLDPLSHLLTLLMDLVTLPEDQVWL